MFSHYHLWWSDLSLSRVSINLFAVITENSLRMAKKGSKDMVPEIQRLREENARLRQKNARLNALLQFLQGLSHPLNTTNIPTPMLQKPLHPLNATNIPTSNAALPYEIQRLREENASFQQENANLATKVRTMVDPILQYG
jgi:FtsZ-binding cell division protein ZapB